ncbi:MAG: hypothetical protein WA323_06150 [Candidatus Nitrosopolaris sp.]|jgi:hypothetical protein
MKNKFVVLMLIVVLCISTNSALAYNKDIANIKQSRTTVVTTNSSPAYKVGVASGYVGKDEFDVTTCAQFQNQSQHDCQKGYDVGFLSNPAHTQSIYFKHGFSGGKAPVGFPDNVGYCATYQTKPLAETECIYGYNSGQQLSHK